MIRRITVYLSQNDDKNSSMCSLTFNEGEREYWNKYRNRNQ